MTGAEIIDRCRALARFSEEPDRLTRTFLSPPMRQVHALLREWMSQAGMDVRVDAAGNMRGRTGGMRRTLYIGSHVDTVPGAGTFDGVLGVLLGVALVDAMKSVALPFAIEVVAFSEEEGVRFKTPFIGSRALAGTIDAALLALVEEAIRDYGLDPASIPGAAIDAAASVGYFEFHIEQGPVLECLNRQLGVVTAIVGQSRYGVAFHGQANHAGTTPMDLRHDALAAAAEWIGVVEGHARRTTGLTATVGELAVVAGAGNIVPGEVRASLDIRHSADSERHHAVAELLAAAVQCGAKRGVAVQHELRLNQPAVPCDAALMNMFDPSLHRMVSGAGHDATIMAERTPIAMLFLRSPGGISHHPAETVFAEDVDAALAEGIAFVKRLGEYHG